MMTELEKVQRAKSYIDRLANGIDPITNREVPDDSVLNNVNLSRCFFYVADILRQVADNGGSVRVVRVQRKLDFALSPEAVRDIRFFAKPVCISEFVAMLNGLIDNDSMKKLKTSTITGWLLEKGFMEIREYQSGRKTRLPTVQGRYIGLSTEPRSGQYGEYEIALYNEDAQHFVIDNLDAILEPRQGKK